MAKHPGLAAVLTARDVPENSFGVFPDTKDQPVLGDHRARFLGEAVACLVGDAVTLAGIRDEDLPIVWSPETAQVDLDAALSSSASALHVSHLDNVLIRGRVVKGDVERALAAAPFVAEGEFFTSHVEHAYIEPEAGYAETFMDHGVERIRVFACTQTPYMDRDEVARVLKLAPERVHIVPSAVGGGFGGKLDVSVQPLLAVAAWKLKRPVRMVYTRPESMLATTKRHPARMRARFACDAEGRLVAADFVGDFNTGAYASWGPTVANRVPIHASGPYLVPHVRALTRAVYTNGPICGAFRGFGVPQSTIVHEALLDELAERVGIDRLEFRHRNALRAGQPTADGAGAQGECRPGAMPRGAASALDGGGHGGRRVQRVDDGPHAARHRHRLHVVRHRQHRDRESVDHARRAACRRARAVLQRRDRHRPGLEHHARAGARRCAAVCRSTASTSSWATPTSRPTPARRPRRARPSCRATPRGSRASRCAVA